jgi:hypothetical protein
MHREYVSTTVVSHGLPNLSPDSQLVGLTGGTPTLSPTVPALALLPGLRPVTDSSGGCLDEI